MKTKTITLEKAFGLLEKARAVILDDNVLVFHSLSNLTDDKSNEFLYLGWESGFREFNLKFAEQGNERAEVKNNILFLQDTDGEDRALTLLVPMKL